MKIKIIPFLLFVTLISQNLTTFANDTEFNANETFKDYVSLYASQSNESWKKYYFVSNSNEDNSKALFSKNKQLTDFTYDSIDINDCGILVSQKKDNTKYFGLISDKDYQELSPIDYKSIENYGINNYKVDKPNDNTESDNLIRSADNLYSEWAEESIKKSIEAGLVPENLQSNYTDKITRQEFCQLAVQTYIVKTGNEIDMSVKTPFSDVDDAYITTAYNLKIVSGVGNKKFAPYNNITRQEAAVMLNNLALVLNINNSTPQINKFIDEGYFADWAYSAIYSVAGIKSGDIYVMTGTGNNKFSPWMNYTREQAIATMLRLYNCEAKELFYDGQYLQTTSETAAIYGDRLYYTVRELLGDDQAVDELVSIKKDGTDRQVLASSKYGLNFTAIKNDYLYYALFDENINHTCYMMKLDKSGIREISEDEMNEALQKKMVHNEKYNFYAVTEFFDGKSFDLYLTRSDLNGENERRLYDNPINGQIILYDNYIYFISNNELIIDGATKYTQDIMRVDFDGNVENITQNNSESLNVSEIVKIENNIIFFKRSSLYLSEKPLNSDLLYSINVDGSNNKLIY